VDYQHFASQTLLMIRICLLWHVKKRSILSGMIRIFVRSQMNVFENILKKSLEKFLNWERLDKAETQTTTIIFLYHFPFLYLKSRISSTKSQVQNPKLSLLSQLSVTNISLTKRVKKLDNKIERIILVSTFVVH